MKKQKKESSEYDQIVFHQSRTIKFLSVLLILSVLAGLITSYSTYKLGIEQTAQYAAKRLVTALEMTIACQHLSNNTITSEQIKEQVIREFILNKTAQTDTNGAKEQ